MAVHAPAVERSIDRETRKVTAFSRLLPRVLLHRALARAVEASIVGEYELPAPALDLGCGDGTFAYATYDEPLAAGIDPDRTMLSWATRHHAHRLLALASGTALPFRDGAFASVVCNSTLEHIRDDATVLREANRVLAPCGTFLLTVPSEHFFPYHLGTSIARRLHLGPLARLYDRWMAFMAKVRHAEPPAEWLERLARAGFDVLDWRYYFTAASMRTMDAAQYLSVPSYATKWLLGRWVVWQGKGRFLPFTRWLARFAHEGSGEEGAFLFFHCRKASPLANNPSS